MVIQSCMHAMSKSKEDQSFVCQEVFLTSPKLYVARPARAILLGCHLQKQYREIARESRKIEAQETILSPSLLRWAAFHTTPFTFAERRLVYEISTEKKLDLRK
jgi:hypothetical protein